MHDQIAARLTDLRREFAIGEERLRELIREEGTVRETLLRISGAIQVLEELTTDVPPNGTRSAPDDALKLP
ncbi:hypothetical protein Acor_55320 [Acrocarpospora corrugata]|uniref:Uncharacterized protein n=1 Tax=Acrocarpospora corrugata TaxID=35763 RepID=A0A5M3W3Z7_9ACTN|nr:hypothetical protein [Acrocarpospora corrugata]GES03466.1 hypothetical protein Acor_55320 [Acrocarpospora corrugata]